jgi:hypothetical protein
MKKLFALLALSLAVCSSAFAVGAKTRADWLGMEQALNLSATAGPSNLIGTKMVKEVMHTLKATYDFSVSGGAIGAITLLGEDGKAAKLPKNAIVRDCIIDVITAPTSGGSATIALGTGQSATDLKAATAIATYTGLLACVPVGSAATAIKLTADSTMSATIATAALTAGKINVWVDYSVSSN